jgi:hypothetical protein
MTTIWSHERLQELETVYIQDRAKGLLTQVQLLRLLHRLDRISASLNV